MKKLLVVAAGSLSGALLVAASLSGPVTQSPCVELTAAGQGYYRVLADSQQVSQHLQEREAIESAVNLAISRPASRVEYTHDYRVLVSACPSLPPDTSNPLPPDTTSPPGNLTSPELLPVLGPIIRPDSSPAQPFRTLDDLYNRNESARFADYASDKVNLVGFANHYDGMRHRLGESIRGGQPFGPSAPASSLYGRGRDIVWTYLHRYSVPNSYLVPAHNNTGLDGIEAYWLLERDSAALMHIWNTAVFSATDRNNYLRFGNKGSDARQIAVALQAMNAAHRLGIPYVRCPCNSQGLLDPLGSWRAAGERLIRWLDDHQIVKQDGSIPSPAHTPDPPLPPRVEAFIFNSMLARELLRWDAFVAPDPRAVELARLIVDHLVAFHEAMGWTSLPYESDDGGPAPDLASLHVFPALAFWQMTGDQKYRDFAMDHIQDATRGFVRGIKQFNQLFSPRPNFEAMLAGVSWRQVP